MSTLTTSGTTPKPEVKKAVGEVTGSGYNGDTVDRVFFNEEGRPILPKYAKKPKTFSFPACCGAFVVGGLSNITPEGVQEIVDDAKKFNRGLVLLITAPGTQAGAEKALAANKDVQKLSTFSNHTMGTKNTLWAIYVPERK